MKKLIKIKKSRSKLLKSWQVVFIALGTNKGDREKNISLALKLLSETKGIKIQKVSNMLKNPPQEGIKSGYFLNGAIKLKTKLNPVELYKACKKIERRLGRKEAEKQRSRKAEIKKSRVIDLDILLYENKVIKTDKLTIPHPKLHKRYFVLIPLIEIAKDFRHPTLKKSIQELYLDEYETIKKYA